MIRYLFVAELQTVFIYALKPLALLNTNGVPGYCPGALVLQELLSAVGSTAGIIATTGFSLLDNSPTQYIILRDYFDPEGLISIQRLRRQSFLVAQPLNQLNRE